MIGSKINRSTRRVAARYAAFFCAVKSRAGRKLPADWIFELRQLAVSSAFLLLLLICGSVVDADESSAGAETISSTQQDAKEAAAKAPELPDELSGFDARPNRVLFTGRPGRWDARIRERGWILRHDDQYHLWYTGYNPGREPLDMKLGYATSSDGIHWKRYDQPIFDEVWIEDMMVIRRDDTFYMFAEGTGDQAQLLKSQDGISWTHKGPLNVRLTSGEPIPEGPYGTPTAWFEDDQWWLFYERRDQGIWAATSPDMQTWTNVSDDPLIKPGPDNYDARMIALNQIVKIQDRYYAVLHGTGSEEKPRQWCTYFAVSDDLKTWTKAKEGPVLPVSQNKSSGVLVNDGQQYLLYTMHGEVVRHEPTGK